MGKLAIFYDENDEYKCKPGAIEKFMEDIGIEPNGNSITIELGNGNGVLSYQATDKNGTRERKKHKRNKFPTEGNVLIIGWNDNTEIFTIEEIEINNESENIIVKQWLKIINDTTRTIGTRVYYIADNDELIDKPDTSYKKVTGSELKNQSTTLKESANSLPPQPPPTPPKHPFEVFINNNLNKTKKNIILYGPPGTGKTYSTKELSLKIKGEDFDDSNKNQKFNNFIKENSIVFTTFHQSVSYEEFIEGIKPVVDDGNIIYKVQDGLFKKISYAALSQQLGITNIGDINVQDEIINKIFSLDAIDVKRYELLKKIVIQQIDGINDHSNLKELYNECKINSAETALTVEVTGPKENKYVLIIDEINRGNVSQIFGELITLIEEDKRYQETNEIKVVLPYSGEVFVVPKNLWIIGTMNTADRSAEALDTALRRRFIFIEMLVNYSIIDNIKFGDTTRIYNVRELLKIINDRIYILKGKDFEIGHSYFMGLNTTTSNDFKAVNNILVYNILPLLQEYFYNDFEKIAHILSEYYAYNKFKKSERNGDKFMGQDQDYYARLSEYIETNIPSDQDIEDAIGSIITGSR